MPRVKGGVRHTKRRRAILKKTKGYEAGRKNLIKLAKTAAKKAGSYAHRDRRVKKRTFRTLWQVRINAAARENGLSYSALMGKLIKSGNGLNRKTLSEIAAKYPAVFKKIVASVV